MIKFAKGIFFVAVVATLLTSCYEHHYSVSPGKQAMTKWETDGFELYITEEDKGLLLCKLSDEIWVYDVKFVAGFDMLLFDRRQQSVNSENSNFEQGIERQQGYIAATASYRSSGDALFRVTFNDHVVQTKNMQSINRDFRRTATNLTPDDIPVIDTEPSYGYCPIYSLGSKWISDDHSIHISVEDKYIGTVYPYHRCPVGKVTINTVSSADMWIVFNEWDSRAYVGNLRRSDTGGECYDIAYASDIWECEFFEDRFVATVITSCNYDGGTVITFSKQN